ncbi:MAG: hypothetical protein MJ233_04985 [Mycoplasmoidaceae bacterium]|nr:hypothetical protein [Mycoplasmoidaceae bacterium]
MGVGDKLQLKGNNPNGLNHGMGSFTKFNFVGKVDISGNIMSLLDDGAFTQTNVPSYGLCALFHPS